MAKRRRRRQRKQSGNGLSMPVLLGIASIGFWLYRMAAAKPLPQDQYPTGPQGEGLYGMIPQSGVRRINR